ncbi:MAG: Bax inhibitor-1/YccA family protein [Prevotella sp.]|nr:Bax inhibitor-1/YccA family protein [Prevotella sp.]MBQ9223206.1 Bax inhibitor-1/YccA family protein [Prevotella sp.]
MDLQQFERSIREDATSSVRQQEIVSTNTFSALMRKVYTWMALALTITGFTAYYVASSPAILQAIMTNQILFFGLLIGELALVWGVSAAINRLSLTTATLLFILYSVLNGVTMSFIFLAYTMTSIASVFFITAGTFAAMSLYGYFTKADLSKMGQILFMALIGLIIATIVNLFIKSSGLTMILSYVGVLIFVGLTAWDTQKIKQMLQLAPDTGESAQKVALMGALSLYLDFINLFLYLLRIFGNSRD